MCDGGVCGCVNVVRAMIPVCSSVSDLYLILHRNDTFNKGKHRSKLRFAIGFVPGLVRALTYEFYMLLVGRLDR